MAIHIRNNLYLVAPLFLGDAFVINALVRRWCGESDQVHLPVMPQNWDTLAALYKDMPNLKLVPYLGNEEEQAYIRDNNLDVINFRTIYETTQMNWQGAAPSVSVPVYWDRQIYEYFDVPYSRRYLDFRIPPNSYTSQIVDKLNLPDKFVLFHRYCSTHLGPINIDLATWRKSVGAPDMPIVEVVTGLSNNLLDWIPVIERASEIHSVASSFHCLVDSIPTTHTSLLYHAIRQNTLTQVNTRWNNWKWNIVHYDYKI